MKKLITDIKGLVLIGGKSSRMKKDKTSFLYYGKKQYLHCYELLSRLLKEVYLSKREDQAVEEPLRPLNDRKAFSGIGPLAGIMSAMKHDSSCAWLVLASDLPFVSDSTLKYLVEKRNKSRNATAYQSTVDGLPEPLCTIYEPQIFQHIHASWELGVQCPRKILINTDIQLIEQQTAHELDNINTPDDYRKVLDQLPER